MTAVRKCRRSFRAVVAVVGVLSTLVISAPPAKAADSVRNAQWHLDYLKVAQAHRITQGAGVTVAVVDTGVEAKHPDLTGAVIKGQDFDLSPASPPDGQTDIDGHGTAMAGLIAGRGHGNGAGVLGIAPKATILPVRHSIGGTPDGTDHTGYTDAAIRWAANQGAKVINMSFGTEPSDAKEAAIKTARGANAVLVASVGNHPRNKAVGYPASHEGVIAVGGINQNGRHADFSVTGSRVDLVAPATDIMSTRLRGSYRAVDGTSSATAIVAGAAALVRAKYPHLTAKQITHRLLATATDKGPKGRDDKYGYGELNIMAALTAQIDGEPAPATATPSPPPYVSPPVKENSRIPLLAIIVIGGGILLAGIGAWMIIGCRS